MEKDTFFFKRKVKKKYSSGLLIINISVIPLNNKKTKTEIAQ